MSVRKLKETASVIVNLEQERETLSYLKLLLLGILGSIFLGFGGLLYATLLSYSSIHDDGVLLLYGSIVFASGLIIVMMSGAQVFCADFGIMAALEKKISWVKVVIKWLVVFAGNIVGAFVLAFVYFNTGLYKLSYGAESIGVSIVKIARIKCELVWLTGLTRSILAGVLIGLAVWMFHSAENTGGKIISCLIPITLLFALGFEYSVANMPIIFLGVLLAGEGVGVPGEYLDMVYGSINGIGIIALGNLIGAVVLFGIIYWFVYKR